METMKTRALPVHEVFVTFQGEASHMGRAAFFIRLQGCPLHCSWCDSAATWHKDYVPSNVRRALPTELALEAALSGVKVVVVTGGEPCIHNLNELTQALANRDLRCHLETSGAFEITGIWDWVTVSPKDLESPTHPALENNLKRADEWKLIIDDPAQIQIWLGRIEALSDCEARRTGNVWLHPEWSKRGDANILNAITSAVVEHPKIFRAGWQLHKLFKADALDPRSAKPVPLGGDPSKGF
jgi:7-carboxy-7-deazaguanine synthase